MNTTEQEAPESLKALLTADDTKRASLFGPKQSGKSTVTALLKLLRAIAERDEVRS